MLEGLYHLMDALLPFAWLRYGFMKNALMAMLLIAPLFGMLGTMAIDNQMAFFSDALGHSALTGVALGVLFGARNQLWPMLAFGVFWALMITFVKHRARMSADTIIGVFSSTSIALGLIILARGGAFAKYSQLLVGDVLSVSREDLPLLLAALLLTASCWCALFNPLLLTSVNASLAGSRGVRASLAEYAFTVLVALAVMVSIRWVGVLLINSLLILPAAASRNVAKNAASYLWIAVGLALLCGVAGLALSYYINTSAGAAVVLLLALSYFATLPFARR